MKKITIFCLFVLLFSMFTEGALIFRVKAESWKMPLTWQSATLMNYSDIKPLYEYRYKLDVAQSKGNLSFQGFSLAIGQTFFKERAEVYGGIGVAKVNVGIDQPEYTTESLFKTIYGYNSPDKQVCIGESVKSGSAYKPFWFVGTKIAIMEKKKWKMGIEGFFLSYSNSGFSFPLQYVSNKWIGAEMEFSVKGNSIKFQMAEAKFFGSIKVSKNLEVVGAVGYLWANSEISGESRYFYSQNLVNVDFNQDWKMLAKPESNLFVEGRVSALLTRNLKASISGSFGAKQGLSVGIQYSFGKEERPMITKETPRVSFIPKATYFFVPKTQPEKPVAKPAPKTTVITPKKEEKKPTVIKTTHCKKVTITKNTKISHKLTINKNTTIKNLAISPTYIYLFHMFNMKFQITIPVTPTPKNSKK